MLYTMKEACSITGMSYEGLKFYCNQGLVPNVQRDAQNHRMFDEASLNMIYGLGCLRKCGMGIQEMHRYIDLPMPEGIPERKAMLAQKEAELLAQIDEIQKSIDYIHRKQQFYDDILANREPDFASVSIPAEYLKHDQKL